MADGFEHFQLAGFNDGDGLRAGNGREAFQEIFDGFAAFKGVNQILQRDTRADKDGSAAHDFGIGVNDAFQVFHCHNTATITPTAKLSPAKMDAVSAPAALRRERRCGSESNEEWQRRFGRTIQFCGETKPGCRYGAASWAEWSGVPFGRAGVLGQASLPAYGVKPVG